MNFEATEKLSEYYPKTLYGQKTTASQKGVPDFWEQLAAAKSAASAGVTANSIQGAENSYYMGKPYREALSKITDPNAANAFRQA